MPAELTAASRDFYLTATPAQVQRSMHRIHRWAEQSPDLRDKVAVDDVLTYVAEVTGRVMWLEVERQAAGYSDDFDDEPEEGTR